MQTYSGESTVNLYNYKQRIIVKRILVYIYMYIIFYIQEHLATSKCDYQTILMNKFHHKECVERDKEQIFKPLMSADDLQQAVCESFNR